MYSRTSPVDRTQEVKLKPEPPSTKLRRSSSVASGPARGWHPSTWLKAWLAISTGAPTSAGQLQRRATVLRRRRPAACRRCAGPRRWPAARARWHCCCPEQRSSTRAHVGDRQTVRKPMPAHSSVISRLHTATAPTMARATWPAPTSPQTTTFGPGAPAPASRPPRPTATPPHRNAASAGKRPRCSQCSGASTKAMPRSARALASACARCRVAGRQIDDRRAAGSPAPAYSSLFTRRVRRATSTSVIARRCRIATPADNCRCRRARDLTRSTAAAQCVATDQCRLSWSACWFCMVSSLRVRN